MTMATAAFNQQNFRFRTVNPLTAAANAAFDVSDPAVNTNLASFDLSSGDAAFRVRFEIEETAGAGENVTWNLYCSHNGGAYFAVNNLSTIVRTSDNTTYADDTATTDLISGSARTFLAGYADDSDAVMPNSGNQAWSGNQHTELDVACTVLAADVADGDTLDFQIRKSGGTTITYTATPRIIVLEAATVLLAGSAAGSSTAAGTLGADISLAATSGGASTASAVLSADVGLAATADGASTGLGNLTVSTGGDVLLAGAAAGSSTGGGNLSILGSVTLTGAADGTSTGDANLTLDVTLAGAAVASSTGEANLTVSSSGGGQGDTYWGRNVVSPGMLLKTGGG